MVCDLCEKKSDTYRSCCFGGKYKKICPVCLSQFKVEQPKTRTFLVDRFT